MTGLMRLAHGQRGWLLAFAAVTLVGGGLILAAPAHAGHQPTIVQSTAAQNQTLNGNLTVKTGQVVQGDAVVYSGDVHVEDGGAIRGNLVVYDGQIRIDKGGVVGGDVTALKGDVKVDGSVNGSINALSGDVVLGSTAQVAGDISVVSGAIKQEPGADVRGSILRSPNLKIPLPAGAPALLPVLPGIGAVTLAQQQPLSPLQVLLNILRRGLMAFLLMGVFLGAVTAVVEIRPDWAGEMRKVMQTQPALSFAAGLLVNVLAFAFIGLLYITICLRPPALLLAIGLLLLNVAGAPGWAGMVGERIRVAMRQNWAPPASAAVGVLAPGIVVAILFSFGGCFPVFGFLVALPFLSAGAGAVIVKALKLGSTPPASAPESALAPAAPPVQQPGAAAPAVSAAQMDTPAAGTQAAAPAAPSAPAAPPALAEPSAAEAPAAKSAAEAALAGDRTAGFAVTAPGDDFTQIDGIGPKLSQRLHDAGFHSLAGLAVASPEQVAAALGWTVDRVVKSQLIEQARALAGIA